MPPAAPLITKALFLNGATCRALGWYSTRADAIQQHRSAYRLIEIKSGLFHEERVDPAYIDDLAYTSMVLRMAGVKIAKAELMLLSRDWRIGMPDDRLFVIADYTEAIEQRAGDFDALWESVKQAIFGSRRPAATLLKDCGKCGYFAGHCLGKGVKNPIFDLPRLSDKRFNELAEIGSRSIHDIPESITLTPPQERVRQAVVNGKPVVDSASLRSLLKKVKWPAFYLDFETVKTAIPIWNHIAPHEQVVTQYSVHCCSEPGRVTRHSEFLADSCRDCRQELAERLLDDTDGTGSVVHYSSFEKTTINGLAKRFPQLAKRLEKLAERLFDLERVFRDAYCHPEFRGRTSIKATLPVLIKGMRYDNLTIGDGGSAMAAFAKMARGQCSADEAKRLRASLLEYCGQDTLAMVKLHEVVGKLVG